MTNKEKLLIDHLSTIYLLDLLANASNRIRHCTTNNDAFSILNILDKAQRHLEKVVEDNTKAS